jgi:hypothetical protein
MSLKDAYDLMLARIDARLSKRLIILLMALLAAAIALIAALVAENNDLLSRVGCPPEWDVIAECGSYYMALNDPPNLPAGCTATIDDDGFWSAVVCEQGPTPVPSPTAFTCPALEPCPTVVYHASPDLGDPLDELRVADAEMETGLTVISRVITGTPGEYNYELASGFTWVDSARDRVAKVYDTLYWIDQLAPFACPYCDGAPWPVGNQQQICEDGRFDSDRDYRYNLEGDDLDAFDILLAARAQMHLADFSLSCGFFDPSFRTSARQYMASALDYLEWYAAVSCELIYGGWYDEMIPECYNRYLEEPVSPRPPG